MSTSTSTDLKSSPFWAGTDADFLASEGSARTGISDEEAAARLGRDGLNVVEMPRGHRTLSLLAAQFASPIVLILVAASVLAMMRGEHGTLALPYLPLIAAALGFIALPIGLLGILAGLTIVYIGANEVVKRLVQRRAM
jgi:Cation transporter/ATPase, N-terminus